MKYGYIKENKVIYVGNDNNGEWEGKIDYTILAGCKVRLTTAGMIAAYSLKPIIAPSTFNGNWQDYNAVEETSRIVIADMIAEVKAEKEKAAIQAEISRLKGLITATDYKVIKYAEAKALSLDEPYTAEEMTALAIERQSYRTQINELELKL